MTDVPPRPKKIAVTLEVANQAQAIALPKHRRHRVRYYRL